MKWKWFILPILASLLLGACSPAAVGDGKASLKTIIDASLSTFTVRAVNTPTQTPSLQITPTRPATGTSSRTRLPSQTPELPCTGGLSCRNDTLRLTWVLPNDTWTAIDWFDGQDSIISSPTFTIWMSNMGRGTWCSRPDVPPCYHKPFFSNDFITLEEWGMDGMPEEIFGVANFRPQPVGASLWISVKYPDMETRQLTSREMDELVAFLNSIHIMAP